ncbi:MAG: hypothetical protein KDH15_14090 [Rhodocyclaceae bacterium]|nr:hypothetical protein [Rhodocyclaceae bacterium]
MPARDLGHEAAAGHPIEQAAAPTLSIGEADLRRLARPASIAMAVGLVAYLATTWSGYGIAENEAQRQIYGRLVAAFLRSGMTDADLLRQAAQIGGGGLFDLLAALLEPVWHGSVWDMRHLLGASFGLAGMLAVWRLAKLLGGDTAALAAVVILTLTGAWSGALFTHTAEIPLAACQCWALYLLTRLIADLPRLEPSLALGFGSSAGAALAIADSGWLMPLCLTVCLAEAARREGPGGIARSGRWLGALLPGIVVGLGLVLLGRPTLWPGIAGPEVGAVVPTLVDGRLLPSSAVPRSYLHEYLVVKLPELMLIGLGLALGGRPWRTAERPDGIGERRIMSRRERPLHLPLALAIVLPIAYAWVMRPALADGLRQFLFLLPPLAVAAALGWRVFWQALRGNPAAAWLMASVAGLLVAIHITTLVHLQPYGHTFYNSLAGGLRGAAYGWVLDYNGSSLRESAQFLDRYLESVAATGAGGRSRPVPVQVCGEPEQVRAAMPRYFEPGVDAADAEFLITAGRPGCVVPRGATVIHTVTRRGTVLGQVVDLRTSRRGARSAPADDYSTISAGLTSP